MHLAEYIKKAESEALKQHIIANTIMLNKQIALVREGYSAMNYFYRSYPPMVLGLTAYLTDELPDNIAFAILESPNSEKYDEIIRQKARQELLDEICAMSIEEIYGLIKEHKQNDPD